MAPCSLWRLWHFYAFLDLLLDKSCRNSVLRKFGAIHWHPPNCHKALFLWLLSKRISGKSVAPPTFPYLSINQSYQMTYRRFFPASPDLAAFLFQNIGGSASFTLVHLSLLSSQPHMRETDTSRKWGEPAPLPFRQPRTGRRAALSMRSVSFTLSPAWHQLGFMCWKARVPLISSTVLGLGSSPARAERVRRAKASRRQCIGRPCRATCGAAEEAGPNGMIQI